MVMRKLSAYFTEMGNVYRTNNLLVPMGDDFSFINAKKNYEIIDKVIEITRQYDSSVNIHYSTV